MTLRQLRVMLLSTSVAVVGCGTQEDLNESTAQTQQGLGGSGKGGSVELKRCFPENGMVKNNDRFAALVQYDDVKGKSWCRQIAPGTSSNLFSDDIDWVEDRSGNWYQVHGVVAYVNSDGTVSSNWPFVYYDSKGPPPCTRDDGDSARGCQYYEGSPIYY